MKKILFLALAMLLCASMAAAAEGFTVEGGYFMGNDEAEGGLAEAKANGFAVSGQADVADPFGVMVNFMYVKNSDFKVLGFAVPEGGMEGSANRCDILATYKLPVEGFAVKAVGGYTFGTANSKIDDLEGTVIEVESKTKGFLVGAAGDFAVMDKLTVSGLFLYGIGVKSETDGLEADTGLTTFKVSAAYQVMDNVAVEAGYLNNKLTDKDTDLESTTSGFFFGGRTSF